MGGSSFGGKNLQWIVKMEKKNKFVNFLLKQLNPFIVKRLTVNKRNI